MFFAQLEKIQCHGIWQKKKIKRAFWINWMESFFWHSIKQKQGTNICNTCPKPLYYIQLKKYHNSSLSKFLIYCYIWMNDVSVSRLNTVMILWSNESMTMSFNQNIIYLLTACPCGPTIHFSMSQNSIREKNHLTIQMYP